jgi:hypothetical protein
MIPRSAPSGLKESSSEPPIELAMEKLSDQAATSSSTRPSPLSTSSNPVELVPETARLACVIDQCTDDHLSVPPE